MSAATPTSLTITPGVESLSLSWGVAGENLGGWLVHWRAKGTTAWSTDELPADARTYLIRGLIIPEPYEVALRALVAGGVESGTGTPAAKPHEEPIEPPKGTNTCLPGINVNWNASSPQVWQEAAAAGNKVGRASGTLKTLAANAHEAGMLLCYLNTNYQASLSTFAAEYAALSAELKAAVLCYETGNENWPGGNQPTSGAAYGAAFVTAANEAKAAKLPIPLLCQVRIAKDVRLSWMEELVKTLGLKEALQGNWLASHPYYNTATLPQKEPANLASTSDSSGNEWGTQRWMKEQYFIYQKLGVLCPVAITEIGAAAASGVPDSVGSWLAVAQNAKALWEHVKAVKLGQLGPLTLPGPYTPQLAFAAWYDQYGNRSGAETFGIYLYEESGQPKGPNENGGLFATYKAGAQALLAA